MSETTVLTDKQIEQIELHIDLLHEARDFRQLFPRAIEQAVLQSPEVQALRKDAERYQGLVSAWLKGQNDADFILMNNPPPDAYQSKEDVDNAIDAAMEKQP